MNDKRLDRLYPALTAKERAVLVLQAHHAGQRHDPMIAATMPYDQGKEFGRLIRIMNAVNVELAMSLVLLRAQLRQTEIKLGWLLSLYIGALEFGALAEYVLQNTKEPITKSGLKQRAAEIGEELVGIDDAVLSIVERDPACQDDDEAWERGWQAAEARVREAIASGALPAKGKGRRARMRWKDVDAWAGTEPAVAPDWGWAYEVYPDAEAKQVERLRDERAFARYVITQASERLALPDDEAGALRFEVNPNTQREGIALLLVEVIPQELGARWQELRAIEQGIEQLAEEEFGGVNPLDPPGREILADCRAGVEAIVTGMRRFAVEVELPEPEPEDIELVEKVVQKAAES